MPARPRRTLPALLLAAAVLILATAAVCGGSDSGEEPDGGASGAGTVSQTPTTPAASPVASPEPTQPVPTPSGPTPGSDFACDRSGPGNRITVSAPASGAAVRSPVTVRGTASVFEATLQVVIRDRTGAQVGGQTVMASEGAPGTGTYEAAIPFTLSGGAQPGCIEVFSRSARDGSVENLVSVRVTLSP
ncbi:MAG TPA: Gmad2 immunoglobulin-like domain-containing protein [Dehalococcoidia bacterium]